jgi:hypothetical protein
MIENRVTARIVPDSQNASGGTLTVKLELGLDLNNPERLAAGISRVMNFIADGCSPEEFTCLLNDIHTKIQQLQQTQRGTVNDQRP